MSSRNLWIDLGSGHNPVHNCLCVDLYADLKPPNIRADITRPIPGLEEGCAEKLFCRHVMEHLPGESWFGCLNEMARLLRSEGTFEVRVPHPSSHCAMVPGHCHVLTPHWWRCMRDGDWLRGRLVIDEVAEVYDTQFLKDRDHLEKVLGAAVRDPLCHRYLYNVYLETVVRGHKP